MLHLHRAQRADRLVDALVHRLARERRVPLRRAASKGRPTPAAGGGRGRGAVTGFATPVRVWEDA
jgi:hypothetical protein